MDPKTNPTPGEENFLGNNLHSACDMRNSPVPALFPTSPSSLAALHGMLVNMAEEYLAQGNLTLFWRTSQRAVALYNTLVAMLPKTVNDDTVSSS